VRDAGWARTVDPAPATVALGLLSEAALAALPDGVVVLDAEGLVAALNPVARHLLDLDAPAEGRPAADVLRLSDEAGRDWWACSAPLRGLGRVRGVPERALRGAHGRRLLLTACYLRDPGSGQLLGCVVSLRPGTGRERSERGAAELVSTVAHELRSPLTSVKGFTATLLAKWERFSDEQKKVMLETVNADADRVTRLLTELLDVSRIDTGRLELRQQVVDLAAALRRSVAGRVAAGEPAERFSVEVVGQLPEMWLDPDKIDQVLANLVENALRHGGGQVSLTLVGDADGATLTVADEGDGVPEEIRTRVFTKFFRGRARRGGTGLGLYIVRGLVEAHGGSVAVAPAEQGGARFVVRLPRGRPGYESDAEAEPAHR
jgi:signal transduction histidine kinase